MRNNEMNATYTQSIGSAAYGATQTDCLDNLLGQDAQDVSDVAWGLLSLIGATLIHLDEINWLDQRARMAKSPADLLLLADEATLAQVREHTSNLVRELQNIAKKLTTLYIECINRNESAKDCAHRAMAVQRDLSNALHSYMDSFGAANPDLSEQSVGSKLVGRYLPRLHAYFDRLPDLDNSPLRRIVRGMARKLNLR